MAGTVAALLEVRLDRKQASRDVDETLEIETTSFLSGSVTCCTSWKLSSRRQSPA